MSLREMGWVVVSGTAWLGGCSGDVHVDPSATGGSTVTVTSLHTGGTNNGGSLAATAGGNAVGGTGTPNSTSVTTGGTSSPAGTSSIAGSTSLPNSGGANTAGAYSGSGGVSASIGDCPPNASGTACGSTLRYCLIGNSQTCACYQGSWFCFGGTGGTSG